MTRAEIRNLIRKRLGETTEAFWSDAELNSWINNGMRDITYRTKCLKTNLSFTPTDGTAEYVLSSVLPNAISVLEVYFLDANSKQNKLTPTSRTVLDKEQPGWLSAEASEPTHYWWDREDNLFYLYPGVKTAVTNSVKAFYAVDSTDLGGDLEVPTLPVPLHLAIVDFVVATGFESRGWSEKANDAWAKCYQRLSDYRVELHREREDDDIIMRNYR